jgi:DNA-binding transcriptional LysR family regulator
VSRKVSDLEAHLKTRLLNRSTRKLTLTDAGRSYVEACKRILEQVNDAERTATGEYSAPKGELLITAPVVFGRLHVLPVTMEFLKAYPEIDIKLQLADRVVNLHEDRVDLAVRIGELPDSSLVASRIGSIRRVVCGSPEYFTRRGVPSDPSGLASHECITFEGLMSPDHWTFGIGKTSLTVRIHSRLVVNTAEAAIAAASGGVGITRVLSYQIESAVHAGELTPILQEFESPPAPVSVIHAGGLLPLKLRAFLDFSIPRLRARLDGA